LQLAAQVCDLVAVISKRRIGEIGEVVQIFTCARLGEAPGRCLAFASAAPREESNW
jgi:hypothetical protein